MGYPLFPDKHRLAPLLHAEDMIEFRRKHGGLGELAAPRSAVLCLYKGAMHRFAWKYPSRRVRGFLGDVYLWKRAQGRVAVLGNFGIGAPAITSLADELLAWGVKRLVILSLAGGLQPDLAPGSVVIADRALRDEGTSYHYLPAARDVSASPALASSLGTALDVRGIASTTGAVWSTDAPYRETQEEAQLYQGEGVKAVDMESAGLFAAAQVRGAQAASVFVIGDSLAGSRWSAPPDMRLLHRRLKSLLGALMETLRALD
ncbi:MAG TPA: nucleoside phosphorylase [Anaerolineales bacterium]|nr:nucleoside phosphorylase [Anaerolineales bacterium]